MPENIKEQLDQGRIASANLMEWLSITPLTLLRNVLTAYGRDHYVGEIEEKVSSLAKKNINTLNETIGRSLWQQSWQGQDEAWLESLSAHASDMVRGWAAYAIVERLKGTGGAPLFQALMPLADDPHFGVREVAWFALRPYIIQHLSISLQTLTDWTASPSANIRRFASEATRPRGVWCAHIDTLKKEPELAIGLLESLRSDPSKYVRDSVGNWLNDASKTRPDFVLATCARWEQESDTAFTHYTIKKALRTLAKQG